MEKGINLLKKFGLRNTPCRMDILILFRINDCALSHSDIEKELNNKYDRVTVYRTLNNFLENGLLHKVLDDGGAAKYALCGDSCSDQNHTHEHVHFKCTECNKTICIEQSSVPYVRLPKGFKIKESSFLVQGVCDKCSM